MKRPSDQVVWERLRAYAVTRYGVTFHDKKDSRLMGVIAFLVRPFNPHFTERFTTVLGTDVYWGTEAVGPFRRYRTLAHELVHLEQQRRDGRARFAWLYSSPQIWTVFALLAPLSVLSLWWQPMLYFLVALAFLAYLAPWGARARTRYEIHAYDMTHAVDIWRGLPVKEPHEKIVQTFTSGDYYWMCMDRVFVQTRLQMGIKAIRDGSYLADNRIAGSFPHLARDVQAMIQTPELEDVKLSPIQ